jgi:hypothetical protein
MFTIDLLKGEGLPVKSKPILIIRNSIPFLILLIVAVTMAGMYVSNSVVLNRLDTKLSTYAESKEFSEVEKFIEQSNARRNEMNGVLKEVSASISAHKPWSQIMIEVVENLPDSLALNKLEIQRQPNREKAKDNDGKPIDITWYKYTMQIGTESDRGFEANAVIEEFVQKLKASQILAPKIDEITVVSKQASNKDNDKHINFQIDCVFKRTM